MSDCFRDFLKYRDSYGMNQGSSNGLSGNTSQNGAMFTVEYLLCLVNDPYTVEAIKEKEINRVKTVLDKLEVKPGLSVRFPGSPEFDSMDNNVALLTFSCLYGNSEYAGRMREHGITVKCTGIDTTQGVEQNKKFYPLAKFLCLGKVKNYWNNNNSNLFNFFGWYGRSPGFMGLIDICAIGDSSWFRKFSLLVGQMLGVFFSPKNQDSLRLPFIAWHLLKDRNKIWNFAYKIWLWRLFKTYANGMQDVYSAYHANPNHPLVKYTVHD